MLAPPADLLEPALLSALTGWWRIPVASIEYRPVGWGSHHWEVTSTIGTRWFVAADDLQDRRLSASEPLADVYGRLRASLAVAADLRDRGYAFVVAPGRAVDGEPLVRVDDRFAVAVYPFVDGQSFAWGSFSSPRHRSEVLSLVVALHTAPSAVARQAHSDDFAVPYRDELEAACDPATDVADRGPYARPASLLLRQNAAPIRQLLAYYDGLVRQARRHCDRAVLTHGEPHPGNTMRTADGLVLIDWDTSMVAPPERDLCHVDPGDGSILDAYAAATGVRPLPTVLDLYRLRWDLADIAGNVSRFRRPHDGNANDDKTWELLTSLVDRVPHLIRTLGP